MGTLYIVGFFVLVTLAGIGRAIEIRRVEKAQLETARLMRAMMERN